MTKNKLALTKSMLEEPKNLSGIFELVPFKESFVSNYSNVTGNKNGELVWEREKMVFMQKLFADPKLSKCTRMSVYSAFTQLATSGLSLVDDNAYLIPYKDVLQFQIGWKGRLEQISRLEDIVEVNEPMVVYASDEFDYNLAPKPSIIKHKRQRERPENDKITHVYITYETEKGSKCLILEAHEVEKIRDNFSQTYKYWKSKDGKYPDGNDMDLPFALAFPEKYFKKTVVKTLYNSLPKTQAMKALDEAIKLNPDVEEQTTNDVQHEVMEASPMIEHPEDEPEAVEAKVLEEPFDESKTGKEF